MVYQERLRKEQSSLTGKPTDRLPLARLGRIPSHNGRQVGSAASKPPWS